MQEEMNTAMSQLSETVGDDVPTLKEVEEKIQARYAKAKAAAELNETSVESRVLEVEQATANVEAQSRLAELRAELGLDGAARPRRSGATAGLATGRAGAGRLTRGPTRAGSRRRQAGSSTRSSRWIDLVDHAVGEVACAAPGDARGDRRRST